ncbi:hypothetical protein EV359DRAFT_77234 [Lentinula novae-zelandiae]|nr:hypothetical protein EV359DRAFT_77234 [Lentinula novae-zelandiae]
MNFPLLLWIIIFLALHAQAKIHLQPQKTAITAGLKTIVVWTRNESDPTEFAVGLKNGKNVLMSEPVLIRAAESQIKGEASVTFNETGSFHLVAFDHKIKLKSAMKLRNNVTLSKPIRLNVNAAKTPSNTTTGNNPTTSPTNPSPSHSQTPVIVAVCLGTVLLAIIGLLLVFLVLRRRHRRSFPGALDDQYAFSLPPNSAPSLSLSHSSSRSWFTRILWDNPTAQTSSITLQNKGNNADEPSWPDTINFYHTPRPPPKALVKKASPSPRPGGGTDVSNGTETSLSSMHFSAKTERQMEIQERIEELNGKLALLQRSIRVPEGRKDSRTLINMTHNMRIGKWRNQIEKLQELMGSDWALGRTDVVPKGLYGPQSIAC